jgi:hypothetical protein
VRLLKQLRDEGQPRTQAELERWDALLREGNELMAELERLQRPQRELLNLPALIVAATVLYVASGWPA